jgi:hypothetical protein
MITSRVDDAAAARRVFNFMAKGRYFELAVKIDRNG